MSPAKFTITGRHQSCAVMWSALILASSLYCASATPPSGPTPPTVTAVAGGPFGYSGSIINLEGLQIPGFQVNGTGFRNPVKCFWSSSTQPLWNQTVTVPNDPKWIDKDGAFAICPPAKWMNGYATPVTLKVSAGGSDWVPVTGGNFDPVDTRNFQATATFNNQSMDYPGYNLAGSGWGTMTLSQQGGITTFSLNWPNFSVPDNMLSNGSLYFNVHAGTPSGNYNATCGNNGGHYPVNGQSPLPPIATARITISGGVATASVQSNLLQLAGGFSVLGKPIVIHGFNNSILACGTILPIPALPTLYGKCVFDNKNISGQLTLSQSGLAPTVVSASVSGLGESLGVASVYSGPTCKDIGTADPAYTNYDAPVLPGSNSGESDALQLTGKNSVFGKTFVVREFFGTEQIGCCTFQETSKPNGALSGAAPLRVCWLMMMVLAAAFLAIINGDGKTIVR